MAYHTPELLLVGAAHNLVLGPPKDIVGSDNNHDLFDDSGYGVHIGIRDGASW